MQDFSPSPLFWEDPAQPMVVVDRKWREIARNQTAVIAGRGRDSIEMMMLIEIL